MVLINCNTFFFSLPPMQYEYATHASRDPCVIMCLCRSPTEKITFQSAPSQQEFNDGDDAEIVCDVVSSPPATIIWKHKGAKIQLAKDGEPTRRPILSLPAPPSRHLSFLSVLSNQLVVLFLFSSSCLLVLFEQTQCIVSKEVVRPHGWCMKEEVRFSKVKGERHMLLRLKQSRKEKKLKLKFAPKL